MKQDSRSALAGQQRFEAAQPPLLKGYQGLKPPEQPMPASSRVRMREACERLVHLCEDRGKPAQAAEWKSRLL